MVKKFGIFFVISGTYLIVHAALLYFFAYVSGKIGLVYNVIMLLGDIFWTIILGVFIIVTGLSLKFDKDLLTYKVILGG